MQVAFGLITDYGFRPAVRITERLGNTAKMFAAVGRGNRKRLLEKNPFNNITLGPHDVVVMTYAKSGTNWMMQIAHQLIWHGKGEYDHLHDVVPWPDTTVMPFVKKYAIPIEEATDWQQSPERMRVIKTHFDWDMLPHSDQPKYIAVIRDPKDIFVSNYHFIRDGVYGPAMPKLETWLDLFLSDDFPIGGSWATNTAGYWAERHRPNVMIASFKEMKRDLRGTVEKVAAFLNIHASPALVDEVCRLSDFEYMKAIDQKFAIGKMVAWREPGVMIRTGKQGGSSEMLSKAQQQRIDEYFLSELKKLGSDFPYEDFCSISTAPVDIG